ncbi:hypothetical protein L204_101605 [Cryptococcus depauperatus]
MDNNPLRGPAEPLSSLLSDTSNPPSISNPLLRLRITHITSDQAAPIPTLRQYYSPSRFATAIPPGCLPQNVAIIRVFGTTTSFQKVCVNTHLCYPYFYVPFPMDDEDPLRPERVVNLCQRFAVSLNHAICLALRQDPLSAGNKANYSGGVDPRHLHVMSVMLVKGIPFYGYHLGYNYFLKVNLANPARLHIALEQLRKPNVLGREWQPHEAHLNHVLQFMCDFDIYGCGWLELGGGIFRDPVPEGNPHIPSPESSRDGQLSALDSLTIPASMLYPPGLSPPKESFTALEIDVLPHQLLNRQRLVPRLLHHDFIELFHKPLDPNEKFVSAVAELWEDERRRRELRGLNTGTDSMMPESLRIDRMAMRELGHKVQKEGLDIKEESINIGGNWKISEELWRMIEERMIDEKKEKGPLTFEKFIQSARRGKNGEKAEWDKWIMTTFDAISAHWPKPPHKFKAKELTEKSVSLRSHRTVEETSSPMNPAASSGIDHSFSQPGVLDRELQFTTQWEHLTNTHPFEDFEAEEETKNPFETCAMTQASQNFTPNPELSTHVQPANEEQAYDYDQYYLDEREDDSDEKRHLEEAKLHAEQTNKIRATQIPARQDTGDDQMYDDEELEELFRQTIAAGLGVSSLPSTPKKSNTFERWAGWTPTKRSGSTNGSSFHSRKRKRDQELLEKAGLGDLSDIIDRSSISISPFNNPYNERLQPIRTPTKSKTPVSEKATPSSLIRNAFTRSHQVLPTKSPGGKASKIKYDSAETIMLPLPKRTRNSIQTSFSSLVDKRNNLNTQGGVQQKLKDEAIRAAAEPGQQASGEAKNLSLNIGTDQKKVHLSLPAAGAGLYEPTSRMEKDNQSVLPLSTMLLKETNRSGANSRAALPGTRFAMSATFPMNVVSDPTLSPTLQYNRPPPTLQQATSSKESIDGDKLQHKRIRLAEQELISASQVPLLPFADYHRVRTFGDGNTGNEMAADTTPISLSWQYRDLPPLLEVVANTMEQKGVASVVYQVPFYSDPADVPPKGKVLTGKMFNFKSNKSVELLDFEAYVGDKMLSKNTSMENVGTRQLRSDYYQSTTAYKFGWEYSPMPPSMACVRHWCAKTNLEARLASERRNVEITQLANATQKNKYGFKFSQKKKVRNVNELQAMTVLTLEVFAQSRGHLLPDPEKDAITAIFYCFQSHDDSLQDTTVHPGYHAGYVVVGALANAARLCLEGIPFEVVEDELELINWVIDTVKYWDPDILAGWEIHNSSWGYLSLRAYELFAMDFANEMSRVLSGRSDPKNDGYLAHHSSNFKVVGRHTLNVWRICRSEVNLAQYTFENVVFHFLHQRIPYYPTVSLTALWKSKTPEHATRVLKYFFQRVVLCMEIIDKAEIIVKTAEFARVFGVDFASVMTRGSQYKVESFLARIAKPESFVFVTPSKQQVGLQNAPFAVPLIAEPESKYYTDPVIVLDFQSLYPSIIIAYNICYSTCLGRVEKFKGTDKFGFTELKVASGLLELLKDYLIVTPNGMIFVKPAVRKSLLAKMLTEILDTRVMIKSAMKEAKDDKFLTSMLNARQLGLKLMANVTYGYTSATYSGRMPCIEIADSIVQTGRETLEKAQEMIHSRREWNARVVYGDTDSLFVVLPGRTKEQAFKIGHTIADTVTAMNPKPVKLKFEKVYMGSVLMAKKRYVGFKYEDPDETTPVFDAKGIETVRRDGFAAQQMMEEVCLKILFRTQDLSQIKEYCKQEWKKILDGRISIQDFIVAKEVRLGTYSEKGVPPPGAAVAYRRILKDPRDEPQYAERVPYLISNADGRRLIDRARQPEELLSNRCLNIDAEYYIRNLLIPPLARIFNLVGADVEEWYDSMPRTKRAGKYGRVVKNGKNKDRMTGVKDKHKATKSKIDSHFNSSHCMLCGTECQKLLCSECLSDPSVASHTLLFRQQIAQSKMVSLQRICASCCGTLPGEKILCSSIDCPLTYARSAAQRDLEDLEDIDDQIRRLSEANGEEIERWQDESI